MIELEVSQDTEREYGRPLKWHVELDNLTNPWQGAAVEVWENETFEISFKGEVFARIHPGGLLERVP